MTPPPTLLITGGAGYIGAHTALFMMQKGYNIIVLDTFKHNQTLPPTFQIKKFSPGMQLFEQPFATTNGQIVVLKHDFADPIILENLFTHNNVHAVIHFAALIEVGESVNNPLPFYKNNVIKTIQLLQTMLEHNIKKFIFSSSCAVYGTPKQLPITEKHTRNPISPYGKNKYIIEMALEDLQKSHGLEFVALRYFNAAGAMPEYGLGEQHNPETHLIPLLLRAAYTKKPFFIFGDDYSTKDGSCTRDYLHVWDLAQAHWRALEHLNNKQPSDFFNLGTGHGFSVKQLVRAVQDVTNLEINEKISKKRAGDPPALIADPSHAYNILRWEPQYSQLEHIIRTAHAFQTQYQNKIPSSRQQIDLPQ